MPMQPVSGLYVTAMQGRYEQHANQLMSDWVVQKQQLQEMAA